MPNAVSDVVTDYFRLMVQVLAGDVAYIPGGDLGGLLPIDVLYVLENCRSARCEKEDAHVNTFYVIGDTLDGQRIEVRLVCNEAARWLRVSGITIL
jgi:hypothetical protein